MPMNPLNLLKPQYLFHPSQILKRLSRSATPKDGEWKVTTLPWGLSLGGSPTETIFKTIYREGILDIEVVEAIFRLLRPGDMMLDVGANIGIMTLAGAGRLNGDGEIHAFEPHPRVFENLSKNTHSLRTMYPRLVLKLQNQALSDFAGTTELLEPGDFSANQGRARLSEQGLSSVGQRITITTSTIDEYCFGRTVAVLKLDVEGHELAVLRGARQALASKQVRNVIFEDHVAFPSPVHDLLAQSRYEVLRLEPRLLGVKLVRPEPESGGPNTSYLACVDPEQAVREFKKMGWRCLSNRGY